MKKLALALLGILIVVSLYYFSTGSEQLRNKMKAQVNQELASLQTQGFSVQNRNILEKQEHFILSFDEPKKIATFLTQKGTRVDAQEIEVLQGLKFGVDVKYLADAYSAVTFDIYPVALPTVFAHASLSQEDKKMIEQFKKLMEKKAFLVHVAINKLGTGFKGHMKDIDEVIQGHERAHFIVNGLTFSGDIKEGKVTSLAQALKVFNIEIDNELSMQLSNLNSQYKVTGKSAYDYNTVYNIETLNLNVKPVFNIIIDQMDVISTSSSKNGLVSGSVDTTVKKVDITEGHTHTGLETVHVDMKASNLDVKAFEKLEKIDVNNEQELYAVLQQLISKDIELDISNFSVAKVTTQGQTMDGFTMSTKFKIDKALDIYALQQNPLLAINAINAHLDIALSQGLFGLIAQHPQAVLTMMLFQPKEVNNQKVYKIELKDGSLSVNGRKAM